MRVPTVKRVEFGGNTYQLPKDSSVKMVVEEVISRDHGDDVTVERHLTFDGRVEEDIWIGGDWQDSANSSYQNLFGQYSAEYVEDASDRERKQVKITWFEINEKSEPLNDFISAVVYATAPCGSLHAGEPYWEGAWNRLIKLVTAAATQAAMAPPEGFAEAEETIKGAAVAVVEKAVPSVGDPHPQRAAVVEVNLDGDKGEGWADLSFVTPGNVEVCLAAYHGTDGIVRRCLTVRFNRPSGQLAWEMTSSVMARLGARQHVMAAIAPGNIAGPIRLGTLVSWLAQGLAQND